MSYMSVAHAHKQTGQMRSSRHRWCSRRDHLLAVAGLLLCLATTAQACANHPHSGASSSSRSRTQQTHHTHHTQQQPRHSPLPVISYEDWSNRDIFTVAKQQRRLLAASSSSSSSNSPAPNEQPGARCGTRNTTAMEHSDIQMKLARLRSRLSASRLSQQQAGMMSIASAPVPTSLTVNLYFHVISGSSANATVYAPVELLAQQLEVMNSAYGPFNIRFALKGVTRVLSEDWATMEINTPEETEMKRQLRKGASPDLNIYIIRPASGTLGWSTFPWEMSKLGQYFDGVVVHIGTLPGGTMAPYNKGYTTVHEVGHWLGLLHVFENGCTGVGDSVDDTPPQATAAYGCPLQRDTCPGNGKDPVTNYMGYTDDACMTGFTRGQADRVLSMWAVYRGDEPPDSPTNNDAIILERGQARPAPTLPAPSPPSAPTGDVPARGMLLPVIFRSFTDRVFSRGGSNSNSVNTVDDSPTVNIASVLGGPTAVHDSKPAVIQTYQTYDTTQLDPATVFASQQAATTNGNPHASAGISLQQQQQQQQPKQEYGSWMPATSVQSTSSSSSKFALSNVLPSPSSTYITSGWDASQVWSSSTPGSIFNGDTASGSGSGVKYSTGGTSSILPQTQVTALRPMQYIVSTPAAGSGAGHDLQSALLTAMGTSAKAVDSIGSLSSSLVTAQQPKSAFLSATPSSTLPVAFAGSTPKMPRGIFGGRRMV